MDEQRTRRARTLRVAGSVALCVAIFWFVLPQVADLSDVWRQIGDMTPLELGSLGAVAIWNLATYWILLVQATPTAIRTGTSDSRARMIDFSRIARKANTKRIAR